MFILGRAIASSGLVRRKSGAGGYDHRGGEAVFLRPLAANHPRLIRLPFSIAYLEVSVPGCV